jgi:hypothetical protein
MKPNFDEMSKAELKAYVLEHRDDLDAIEALFSRRSPNSQVFEFPFAQSEAEWQQQLEAIRPILERDRAKANQQHHDPDTP